VEFLAGMMAGLFFAGVGVAYIASRFWPRF
jgi:hypothetical protein